MSSCTITFHNNPQAVFYGGQTLSGTAVLHTVKPKTIRAIHIEINGYAKVRWTERKSRRSGNRTVHYTETYSSHDQYLASRTYVVGREGGDSVEFAAGTHTYSFQVQLPPQIPSSFNGKHGHIRYEVVLTVDRPWRFDNVFKVPFTVISTLDLNLNPSYKIPLKQEVMKEFNCGCCGGQPLKVCCNIPFSGYAPGQKINFTLLVLNESTVDCYGSKVKLDKTVRFTSTSPHTKSRFETMKIVEKRLDAIPKLTNKEFKDFIQLPAIPPSSLQTCRIIEVFYMFTAVVYTSGCHRNAELTFPITIGTYPLRESATNPANVVTVQPTAPKLPENGHDAPPAYFPPNAPPSYQQAVGMNEEQFVDDDEDKHAKNEPFVPKYPVYYDFALPSAPSTGLNNGPPATAPSAPNFPSSSSQSSAPLPYPPSNPNLPATSAVESGKDGTTYGWSA